MALKQKLIELNTAIADKLNTLNSSILIINNDKHYVYTQNMPESFWEISHLLDKKPSVTVVDSADEEVEGEITHIDNNNLTISFNGAFSGKAYLN